MEDRQELFENFPEIENFIAGTMQQAKTMIAQMKSVSSTLKAFKNPCLVIIKPSAQNLSQIVLDELKAKGFQVRLVKTVYPTQQQVEEHYAEHRGKDFFDKIVQQMTSGPVTVAVVGRETDNDQVVADVRKLVGATDPKMAEQNTIRARFGTSIDDNVIHASDCNESARREIKIWFSKNE